MDGRVECVVEVVGWSGSVICICSVCCVLLSFLSANESAVVVLAVVIVRVRVGEVKEEWLMLALLILLAVVVALSIAPSSRRSYSSDLPICS